MGFSLIPSRVLSGSASQPCSGSSESPLLCLGLWVFRKVFAGISLQTRPFTNSYYHRWLIKLSQGILKCNVILICNSKYVWVLLINHSTLLYQPICVSQALLWLTLISMGSSHFSPPNFQGQACVCLCLVTFFVAWTAKEGVVNQHTPATALAQWVTGADIRRSLTLRWLNRRNVWHRYLASLPPAPGSRLQPFPVVVRWTTHVYGYPLLPCHSS